METLSRLYGYFVNFFNSIGNVFSYMISIFKTLRFGLTSLLSEIGNLLSDLVNGTLFDNLGTVFSTLGDYIGYPGVIVLSTVLLIAMLRIIIAFVFKIFRLNIDYHTLQDKYKYYELKNNKK